MTTLENFLDSNKINHNVDDKGLWIIDDINNCKYLIKKYQIDSDLGKYNVHTYYLDDKVIHFKEIKNRSKDVFFNFLTYKQIKCNIDRKLMIRNDKLTKFNLFT